MCFPSYNKVRQIFCNFISHSHPKQSLFFQKSIKEVTSTIKPKNWALSEVRNTKLFDDLTLLHLGGQFGATLRFCKFFMKIF